MKQYQLTVKKIFFTEGERIAMVVASYRWLGVASVVLHPFIGALECYVFRTTVFDLDARIR